MREILFRGRLKNGKGWSYGNLNVSKTGFCIITPDDTPIGRYGRVDPETVGQYTGLRDKDGKRIFEGDIFRDGFDVISVVEWTEDGRFLGFAINKKPTWDTKKRLITYIAKEAKIEVIGNIHDNPELLEGDIGQRT